MPKGVSGHLIKRTDTDAVSASSLFRVAFPSATAEQEQQEMDWIATQFDTKSAGNDAEPSARLTGTVRSHTSVSSDRASGSRPPAHSSWPRTTTSPNSSPSS